MPKSNAIGYIPRKEILSEIKRVEKTEGLKFKRVPKIEIVRRQPSHGHNLVERAINPKTGKIESIKRAKVSITERTTKYTYMTPILLHELRENLYLQHGLDKRKKEKRKSPSSHRLAQKWWKKDESWGSKHRR